MGRSTVYDTWHIEAFISGFKIKLKNNIELNINNFLGPNIVVCFLLKNIMERTLDGLNDLTSEDRKQNENVQIVTTVTFLAAIIQA